MIYVIRESDSDFVKIGHCKSLRTFASRLKTLMGSCPRKLTVEATMDGSKLKERYIHSLLIEKHENGEWFRLTQEEVEQLIKEYKDWVPLYNGVKKVAALHSKMKDKYFKK